MLVVHMNMYTSLYAYNLYIQAACVLIVLIFTYTYARVPIVPARMCVCIFQNLAIK